MKSLITKYYNKIFIPVICFCLFSFGIEGKNIESGNAKNEISFSNVTAPGKVFEKINLPPSKIIFVDSSNIVGAHNGISWATAFNKMEDAITAASPGDSIWVVKGTYQPAINSRYIVDKHLIILGGFNGTESNVMERDVKNNPAILKGNGSNILHFINSDDSELNGFIVTNSAGYEVTLPYIGAGKVGSVFVDNVSVKIINCQFYANIADRGAAIFNNGNVISIDPAINHCTFTNNIATQGGGAIYNNGNNGHCDPTINNCTFTGNTANRGGAVYNLGYEGSCNPSINYSVFSKNNAESGGALYVNNSAGISAAGSYNNCIYYKNQAHQDGGVIMFYGSGEEGPVFTNCTMAKDSAQRGNLIFFYGGKPKFQNCIVDKPGNNNIAGGSTSNSINIILFKNCLTSYPSVGSNPYNLNNKLGTDPMFENINLPEGADYVWSTNDDGLKPLITSKAINAGDNELSEHLIFDIKGDDRVINGIVDIGAFEFFKSGDRLFVDSSNITGVQDGLTWNTAFNKLEDAIAIAAQGNSIWVAKGTYMPPLNGRYVVSKTISIIGGFDGTETNVSQNSWKTNITILKGNGSNILHFKSSTKSLLEGFTITGSTGWPVLIGNINKKVGAIFNDLADTRITNCIFTGNSSDQGGAIYNNAYEGVCYPVISKCIFNENVAEVGGAIYNSGNPVFTSLGQCNPTVINCVFNSNSAEWGGAIGSSHKLTGPVGTYTQCVFYKNVGVNGSFLYFNSEHASGPLFTNCTILGGNSSGDLITRYLNENSQPLRIYNCIIDKGETTGLIGGNTVVPSEEIVFRNCLLNFDSINLNPNNIFNKYKAEPFFTETDNPIGPDGFWGSDDDGLQLQTQSLGIDAGDSSLIIGTVKDFKGSPRIAGSNVDIGAYESSFPSPTKLFVNHTNINNPQDGKTWNTAFVKLEDAIFAATLGDSIWVSKGTYQPPFQKRYEVERNLVLLGGFDGTESNISERDWNTNQTILKGNDEGMLVFRFTHGSELDGFTLTESTGGSAFILAPGETVGAIFIDEVNMRITNCNFLNNNEATFGSCIYNNGGSPIIETCNFSNNSSVKHGGAIYNDGEYQEECKPIIKNCVFTSNTAVEFAGAVFNAFCEPTYSNSVFESNTAMQYGGAIYEVKCNTLMENCSFRNNSSINEGGGAIYINGNYSVNNLTMNHCSFSNNSSLRPGLSLGGGAIYLNGSNGFCNSTFNDCIFSKNISLSGGGAIANNGGFGVSYPVFNNCIFEKNSANMGGAISTNHIQNLGNPNGILINNSLFIENYANYGGLLNYHGSEGHPKFINCTMLKDSAMSGNLLVYSSNGPDASPWFYNCIIDKPDAGEIFGGNTPFNGVVFKNCLTSYTSLDANPDNQNNILEANPNFVNKNNPIGPDNFWATADDGLIPGLLSQAINSGDNTLAVNLDFDILNQARISGVTIDIGGYEVQDTNPKITIIQTPLLGCFGLDVSFDVSSDMGTIANVSWFVNEEEVQQGTATTFTANNLSNLDVIKTIVEINTFPQPFTTSKQAHFLDAPIVYTEHLLTVVPNNGLNPYSYLWNTGDTNSSIEVFSNGTYSVTVTDANGCQTVSSYLLTDLSSVDKQNRILKIYPNPTKGDIKVSFPESDHNNSIIITDMSGVIIYSDVLNKTSEITLDIKSLVPGIYIIQVQNEKMIYVNKLVKM